MEAVRNGDKHAVIKLLNGGTNVDEKTELEDTALAVATYSGHLGIAQLLLEKGANPNLSGRSDRTALIIAADKGYIQLVKLLLKKGANASHVPDSSSHNQTALEIASVWGHREIVELLMPHLDPKRDMTTALVNAAWKGYNDIVRLLLEAGADPNVVRKKNRRLPLLIAVEEDNYETVKLLLQYGANANQTSGRYNVAPLQSAVSRGHINIAESLIQGGANIAVLDSTDRMLMDKAVAKGDKAMIALLNKYNAPGYSSELAEFVYAGIEALEKLATAKDINAYLEEALGKPVQMVELEGKRPFHSRDEPGNGYTRIKWVYDGLHIIVATAKDIPDLIKLEYIELSSSEYKLIYGLRIGQNIQQFVDKIGTPIRLPDGMMLYRIRKETSHFTYDDVVKLGIDENKAVRKIIWEKRY